MTESTADIELSEYSKEELIKLILFAHERNITFNEAICQILKESLDKLEKKNE